MYYESTGCFPHQEVENGGHWRIPCLIHPGSKRLTAEKDGAVSPDKHKQGGNNGFNLDSTLLNDIHVYMLSQCSKLITRWRAAENCCIMVSTTHTPQSGNADVPTHMRLISYHTQLVIVGQSLSLEHWNLVDFV